jgi:hyperosmotically inducible periplasmic protein
MLKGLVSGVLVGLIVTAASLAEQVPAQRGAASQARLEKEVRHVLVTLPFYSVFDNLAFKVDGDHVTLLGQTVTPTLKSDAGKAVKSIEGVAAVDNQIEVLPPSPADDQIRRAEFRAIYSAPGMEKYAIQAVPPIHIIVKGGRVTLVGVVANQMDKILAETRAKSVPGTFSVTDELRVEK